MPVSKITQPAPNAEAHLEMRTFAFFSLWNPHNIKLEAATYRIKFKADGQIFVVETTDEASGDEPILYHSNEEPSGNVALSGWSYQQNTRSIISPRSSTGDIVQDLEFTFESAPPQVLSWRNPTNRAGSRQRHDPHTWK